MPILATRGCPYQCTFCSSPSMWTTRYIMRDPKEIVDEIEWLINEYNANNFEFFDVRKNLFKTDKIKIFNDYDDKSGATDILCKKITH